MTRNHRSNVRIRQQGQTLIIALIVMGVLLVLGLVFIGLINRNILNAARSQRRSESTDLAEAGIRYAHGQLVSSPLGADWRGIPATFGAATTSRDPDIYYMRPASGLPNDLGGPDMLGPFVRVQFPNGRSLVRVRYGAADASLSAPVPGGPLRNPGAARSMLIIESVGRPGNVLPNDPTTLTGQALQFAGFADVPTLRAGIAAMAQANGQISTSRRLVAFAPIGIIDAARFETNVFNSSAPIELGIADGLGITSYDPTRGNEDVGSNLSMQLGTASTVSTLAGAQRGFGSIYANGDLKFYGLSNIYLSRTLGDSIRVAGRISGSNNATLKIFDENVNLIATLTDGGAGGTGSFDSQDPNFSTASGLLLDGSPRTDVAGYPSGVGRLIPPSTLTIDPQTKLNRYVAMTRESGLTTATGNNTGRFGYGQGIYVDNASDRQQALDAEGRKTVGSQRSLFDDWLNPNSGAADSGWKGPFYVPRGAVMQLLPDGWTIQRDGSGPTAERTWKNPDGSDSGLSTIRYRVGRAPDGTLRTLNTLSFADRSAINGTGLDFSQGTIFNGVLYFEGNVRVRGTIPTGVQMTLVSGATVYIDGPIVKGTTNNEVFSTGARDEPINGLPTASIMLMAKDNVAVNTSMFFGPEAAQALESVNDVSGATGISPVRLRSSGGSEAGRLGLLFDLGLDPNDPATGFPYGSAQSWRPYAMRYQQWDATVDVPSRILLGHTMDDGTAAASFLTMDVNFGTATASAYQFNAVDPDGLITNSAAAYTGTGGGTIPLYGLGSDPWQRYSRFELRAFDLLAQPSGVIYSPTDGRIDQAGGVNYKLFAGSNDLVLRPGSIASVSTNDTLIGRVALTPSEAKIEASIFAEQGSFFVIPGPWFNPNPNDRHDQYTARVNALQAAPFNLSVVEANTRAARERLEAYGAAPWVPFYGEPLDVRLSIVGSVAENLPPPIAVQSEWVRKWGWIPRRIGAATNPVNGNLVGIPKQHVPAGYDITNHNFVPNLSIQYDPMLATGRSSSLVPIRQDNFNRPLPPMPRLPVSPRLAYFGEL